jgi:hypothetical protein
MKRPRDQKTKSTKVKSGKVRRWDPPSLCYGVTGGEQGAWSGEDCREEAQEEKEKAGGDRRSSFALGVANDSRLRLSTAWQAGVTGEELGSGIGKAEVGKREDCHEEAQEEGSAFALLWRDRQGAGSLERGGLRLETGRHRDHLIRLKITVPKEANRGLFAGNDR